MKKIISLFQRNYDTDKLVRDEVVPGAEWVLAGEGVATRKWDGTCCMIKGGLLFKRHELKKDKAVPAGFVAAQDPDPITGDQPGWIPVGEGSEDRWHREGFQSTEDKIDGTYELVGPKVNGNPDDFPHHVLVPHGKVQFEAAPRDFERLKVFLGNIKIEGLVWHHPDGRMVKIKRKDFFKKATL